MPNLDKKELKENIMKVNINDVVEVSPHAINPFHDKPGKLMVKIMKKIDKNQYGDSFLVRKLWGNFEESEMSEAHFKKVIA